MLYLTHRPGPPLSRFIESIWYFETAPAAGGKESVLPSAEFQLILPVGDSAYRNLFVGPYFRPTVIDTSWFSAIMGVQFKPCGAAAFLSCPASELHNSDVPLDDLWGETAREIRHRIQSAPSIAARFHAIEITLARALSRDYAAPPAVAYAVSEFHRTAHARKVGDVAQSTGYSQTRFIEMFKRSVGLTPKLYCRVQRLQSLLRMLPNPHGKTDWAGVAIDSGYFDQAHLIHEFQALCAMTPEAYLRNRGPFQNHVRVDS